jgi:hypothetical protein
MNELTANVNAEHLPFYPTVPGEIDILRTLAPRRASLSHVALPITPDDPLYGQFAQADGNIIFPGDLALRGERGLLKIPEDWLLRMRCNPFNSYLEKRAIDWMETADSSNIQ